LFLSIQQWKEILMKYAFAVSLLGLSIGCIGAMPASAEDDHYISYTPGEIKWVDNPALAKGAKIAGLPCDPKTGPYIYRIKFPPHYLVPPHTHPDNRTVTVLSGTIYHGDGTKLDTAKLHAYPTGSIFGEGHVPHFGGTKDEEAVIQVSGTGPTGIDYIDAADDPRKK